MKACQNGNFVIPEILLNPRLIQFERVGGGFNIVDTAIAADQIIDPAAIVVQKIYKEGRAITAKGFAAVNCHRQIKIVAHAVALLHAACKVAPCVELIDRFEIKSLLVPFAPQTAPVSAQFLGGEIRCIGRQSRAAQENSKKGARQRKSF